MRTRGATAIAVALVLAVAPPASAQAPNLASGSVLVIGDSLGVGTEPYLEPQL